MDGVRHSDLLSIDADAPVALIAGEAPPVEILRLFAETHKGDPLPHPTMRACRVHSSRELSMRPFPCRVPSAAT